MINIVFEGAPRPGKTTIINEVVKKLKSFGIKVENTVDIDPTTPLYPILHNMNCTTPLITSNIEFSTVLYETFIQTADYFYIKERILKQNNEINIFDRFYFSIYAYQKVLLEKEYGLSCKPLLKDLISILKFNNLKIDLVFYFVDEKNVYIERAQKRDNIKYSKYEIETLKLFEKELEKIIMHQPDYKVIKIFNENKDIVVANIVNEVISIYKGKGK